MKLAGWLLRWVDPEHGGAAPKTVLVGLAEARGFDARQVDGELKRLVRERLMRKVSDRRHTLYALPRQRRAHSVSRGRERVAA